MKEDITKVNTALALFFVAFSIAVIGGLVIIPIAISQEVQAQPNNPTASERACPEGFTLNRGICEQPATPFLTCPGDRDYTLEENEKGKLVCNDYITVTEPLQVDEETGQVYCNDPFKPNPVEEPFECRYRYVSETVKPITDFGCPDGGDLNRETNTCQMRPGHQ
jgi:hypothetical protein